MPELQSFLATQANFMVFSDDCSHFSDYLKYSSHFVMFSFFSLAAVSFTYINSRNLKTSLNALILKKYVMHMKCENSNPNHL